ARHRRRDRLPQSEAARGALRRTRDGAADRAGAISTRRAPDLALRGGARALRRARPAASGAPRACRQASRLGFGAALMDLQRCLAHLDEAIEAAAVLGIDATAAANVRDTARTRLGFPSDAYVLAMAGGTGVGKSTILKIGRASCRERV